MAEDRTEIEADEAEPAPRMARSGLMTAKSDWAEDEGGLNPRDYVSSLARGLEVLRAFNRTGRKMTLTEVAAETGNTRAGARRILLTLVRDGYAVADGKLFDLTPQVLELGYSVLSSKGVWEVARPFIDHLSEELRESVSAAVLDRFDVVYVSGAQYHRVITVGISVGSRFPAHCTATGRVLLAAQAPEMWPGMLQNIPLTALTDRTVTDRAAFRAGAGGGARPGLVAGRPGAGEGADVHRGPPARPGRAAGGGDQRGRAHRAHDPGRDGLGHPAAPAGDGGHDLARAQALKRAGA